MLITRQYLARVFFCFIFINRFLNVLSNDREVFIDKCPKMCLCTRVRNRESSLPEQYKMRCGDYEKIKFISQIDLLSSPFETIQLDLSSNELINITRHAFISNTGLQKLDLSKNQISYIENEAFYNLTKLKKLDLSDNNLKYLIGTMFIGLSKVEKLKLGSNYLNKIERETFKYLGHLQQLDISDNPLLCDCNLKWLIEWTTTASIKLTQVAKCVSPPHLRGQPLRKLRANDLNECWGTATPPNLEIEPSQSQVVFEGDSLRLTCHVATNTGDADTADRIAWTWLSDEANETLTESPLIKTPFLSNNKSVQVETVFIRSTAAVESRLTIQPLMRNHSGRWRCGFLSESGNHTKAVAVLVISEQTRYCPAIVTRDNRGIYAWPRTVVGHTVELTCSIHLTSLRPMIFARFTCTRHGNWTNLDTHLCPFVSETTRLLEQFAKLNMSLSKSGILETAKRLRNLTTEARAVKDPWDVVFLARTISNILSQAPKDKDLGALLVEIVSATLQLPRDLMAEAQALDNSCSRLSKAVERVSEFTPALHLHKWNLAVEQFRVKRESFPGLSCTWYSHVVGPAEQPGGRFLHCATSNRSTLAGNNLKVIEAFVQVPSSLFYQLEIQGFPVTSTQQLLVAMYENSRLFPRFKPRPLKDSSLIADRRDIASCVVGAKLVGIEVKNLSEPVYVMVRAPPLRSDSGARPGGIRGPRPAWWDSTGGPNRTGAWTEEGCRLSHFLNGMLVFQCHQLGYYALLDRLESDDLGLKLRSRGAQARPSPAAVYVGSILLSGCLALAISTHIVCHTSIHMAKRTRHALINTWVALALLSFIFCLGIYQTEDTALCRGIGIVLHYFTISSLLWMGVTASTMYKRLNRNSSSATGGGLAATPSDELPPDDPALAARKSPLLGLYLIGWGIALIVCGISGAVNMRDYASHTYCFLPPGVAFSSVAIPAFMIIFYITVVSLLIRCAIRDSDATGKLSQGTQAVDLELLDAMTNGVPGITTQRPISTTPSVSSEAEDAEHTPCAQLKAQVIVLGLSLVTWILGAASIIQPGGFETVFSLFYCGVACSLGTFILFFWCFARNDVREQWDAMCCLSCRRRRGRCCRTRSVSDAVLALPPQVPVGPPSQTGLAPVLASSVVSARSTTPSLNGSSNAAKMAAVELNHNTEAGIVPTANVNINKTANWPNARFIPNNNVNLVVLRQHQYRSNGSVATYTEPSGASGAEMFYDPRQSTVARKFFRKQRRQMRQNNLGTRRSGDGGLLNSDGEYPKPLFHSGLERLVIGAEGGDDIVQRVPCKIATVTSPEPMTTTDQETTTANSRAATPASTIQDQDEGDNIIVPPTINIITAASTPPSETSTPTPQIIDKKETSV